MSVSDNCSRPQRTGIDESQGSPAPENRIIQALKEADIKWIDYSTVEIVKHIGSVRNKDSIPRCCGVISYYLHSLSMGVNTKSM